MRNIKPTRLFITSFYVSSLVSFYIFQLIPDLLFTWTQWILSVFATNIQFEAIGETTVWWALLCVCMAITFMIRKFIIQPLGFYVNGNASSDGELVILSILCLGFYLYSFNTLFPEYTMPATFNLINILLGDSRNFLTVEERDIWTIVPWIWYIGPIAYMFSMYLRSEMHFAKSARDGKDDK